jgi:hypothetical protein
VRNAFPDFVSHRRQLPGGVCYSFSATVRVEGYEARRVTVLFQGRYPSSPIVLADGPTDSPHRYTYGGDRRRLCLWFPGDPAELRWIPEDGLLALFGIATMHLFKEAWWRETGQWLGQEYPHDEDHDEHPKQAA